MLELKSKSDAKSDFPIRQQKKCGERLESLVEVFKSASVIRPKEANDRG
jgi:hypothetical protein